MGLVKQGQQIIENKNKTKELQSVTKCYKVIVGKTQADQLMDGQMDHQTNLQIDRQTDRPSKRDALLQKAKKIVKRIVNCSSPSKEKVNDFVHDDDYDHDDDEDEDEMRNSDWTAKING